MTDFSPRQDFLMESDDRLDYEMAADLQASCLEDDNAQADADQHDSIFTHLFTVIDSVTRMQLFWFDSAFDFLAAFPQGINEIGPECELRVGGFGSYPVPVTYLGK